MPKSALDKILNTKHTTHRTVDKSPASVQCSLHPGSPTSLAMFRIHVPFHSLHLCIHSALFTCNSPFSLLWKSYSSFNWRVLISSVVPSLSVTRRASDSHLCVQISLSMLIVYFFTQLSFSFDYNFPMDKDCVLSHLKLKESNTCPGR